MKINFDSMISCRIVIYVKIILNDMTSQQNRFSNNFKHDEYSYLEMSAIEW